jgi:uncharacterized protein (TIGR02391 family)
MSELLRQFEKIVRRLPAPEERNTGTNGAIHPFDERNIHPEIARVSKKLFDDGHYSQATFEAFKYIDTQVQSLSHVSESGWSLMMTVFDEKKPIIRLTAMTTKSEIDEQKGYRYLFGGSMSGIRNPRGHEVNMPDTIDQCLDHLSVASVLLRRLEKRHAQ